jgi:[ribosomal protein S5]-alanine N-acetyltransferase
MGIEPATFELVTERLVLRLPGADAAPRVAAYYAENRAHHGPWEPPRAAEFFTAPYWKERLEVCRAEALVEHSLRLIAFGRGDPDGEVHGIVSLTNIVRGPLQACSMGYNLAKRLEGQGYMYEAVVAVIDHVWDGLGLHRIEAAYMPTNERSGRLLRRLGFVVEGYSRDYLFTGGRWTDQLRTALINPRFPESWNAP